MVTVTCAGTGWPFRVAGSYRYCFKAATAASRNDGGPDSTLMDSTLPSVPTTASITTFPDSKSRTASIVATARTDLINFGGTITPATSEGAPESEAVFAIGGTVERFAVSVVEGGVFPTTGCATDSLDTSGWVGASVGFSTSGAGVLDDAPVRDGVLRAQGRRRNPKKGSLEKYDDNGTSWRLLGRLPRFLAFTQRTQTTQTHRSESTLVQSQCVGSAYKQTANIR